MKPYHGLLCFLVAGVIGIAGCTPDTPTGVILGNGEPAKVQSIAQCRPGYFLSVTPASASITAGSSQRYQLGLTSVCGLAGSINVGTTSIKPADNGNGPRPHQTRYDLPLTANGTSGVTVTFSTSSLTLRTTYTITITATDISGGCCYGVTHTAIVSLIVK